MMCLKFFQDLRVYDINTYLQSLRRSDKSSGCQGKDATDLLIKLLSSSYSTWSTAILHSRMACCSIPFSAINPTSTIPVYDASCLPFLFSGPWQNMMSVASYREPFKRYIVF
ncbi:hypothetical protein E4T56_gene13505 [Termitomyces sp. T112]|nr:hypothetical protein E4T56_gene13505 [Termitomyces sp. T112]